jgi:ArsR family transcriptional regulator
MTEHRELLRRIAERLRALGDATRLEILHALEGGELCVGDVLEHVGGSQANVSKHLAVLRRAGIVEARREGLNVFYRTVDDSAFTICRCAREALARHVAREQRAIAAPALVARRHPARAATSHALPPTKRSRPRSQR